MYNTDYMAGGNDSTLHVLETELADVEFVLQGVLSRVRTAVPGCYLCG